MLFTLSARSSGLLAPSGKRLQVKRPCSDDDLSPAYRNDKSLRGNDENAEASLNQTDFVDSRNTVCYGCSDYECEYRVNPEAAVQKSLSHLAAASPHDPTLYAKVLPALLNSVSRDAHKRHYLLVSLFVSNACTLP